MAEFPIVIAGAGIGGLTVGLALARAGVPVTIVERRTKVEEVGAGLQLSPNASHVLIALGLGPALSRSVAEPKRLVIRNALNGKALNQMPLGEAMRNRYGAPYWTIHRADLQTILLDAIRSLPNIRLVFGRTVVCVEPTGSDGVMVTLQASDALETLTGRALIGADGLWSNVARLIGDTSEPEFHHHVAWRGLIPIEEWPTTLPSDETSLWMGPGAHLVHYPIRQGRMINVVAITSDTTNEPGWSRPGEGECLNARLAAWHPNARAVTAAVPEWQVWSLYDRKPRTCWNKGLVTLIGDAAHPVLPFLAQGGAMAIEDAMTLAAAIVTAPNGLEAAFRTHNLGRQQRLDKLQATSRRNGAIYHLPWPVSVIRDFTISKSDISIRYEWIYKWKIESFM